MDSSLKENSTVMEKVAEILKGVQIQSPFYKGMSLYVYNLNCVDGMVIQLGG